MTDKELETSKTVFYDSLGVLIRIYKTNKHRLTISMLVFSQRKRVTADNVSSIDQYHCKVVSE